MLRQKERSVSFGDLTVLEFSLGIGDNPSVSGGAPLSLSKHVGGYQMEMDEYEELKTKRPKSQLLLDRDTRMNILRSNGVPEKDIADAVRTSRNIRHSRERSMSNRGFDPVHEVAEKAFRKFTKPFGKKSKTLSPTSPSSVTGMSLHHAAMMSFKNERNKHALLAL